VKPARGLGVDPVTAGGGRARIGFVRIQETLKEGDPKMSRERAKILQMVADGTITPEEGEKLLNRLDSPAATVEPASDRGERKAGSLKYLRVVVDGKDNVNIRIPIALVRTGIKLTTLMPSKASKRLSERGIDLSQFSSLDGEELVEALRELNVEVNTDDGDVVRVFCE
jgi:hypothetical protein